MCNSFKTYTSLYVRKHLQVWQLIYIHQVCTTILGQGLLCIIFRALEGRRQNSELNFRESSIQNRLFWIVISCKMFNSSMKFTFIHIISVIQERFLVFFNLLWGRDKTLSGAGSGPRVVHPCPKHFPRSVPVYKVWSECSPKAYPPPG